MMRLNFNPLSIVPIILAIATPLAWKQPEFRSDYAKLLDSCLTIAATAYTAGSLAGKKDEA